MKLVLAALCAYGAAGAKTYKAGLKVATAVLATEHAAESKKSSASKLGKKGCRCIGISDLAGTIEVNTGSGKVDFPAELGASCQAWENATHPSCKILEPLVSDFENSSYIKDNPDWCLKAWCYVDPCECDLDPPPKTSSYLPDGMYQGKPLYYSYATCGSVDSYTSAKKLAEAEKDAELPDGPEVCEKDVDESVWGDEGCMCIGLDGQPGSNEVHIKKKTYNYSANLGSRCSAWDDDKHPSCTGSNPPTWCKAKWCYVDPCECALAVPPKTSAYLPGAKYQGHTLYYSYATCKSEDSFTASESKEACTNQEEEDECNKLDKCAWSEGMCLGKEIVTECTGKQFEDEDEEQEEEAKPEKEDDKSSSEESPEDKAVAESIDDDKSEATPKDESEEKEDNAAEKEEEAKEEAEEKAEEKADEEAEKKDAKEADKEDEKEPKEEDEDKVDEKEDDAKDQEKDEEKSA